VPLRTSCRGDAERAARSAQADGFELLVAAGGDGTVNEIANGLAAAGSDLPMALLPMGTANVLAAEIGLAPDAAAVLRMIERNQPRTIHLGRGGERPFVLMASVGLDAAVVRGVDLALKRRTGRLAYAVEAIAQGMRYAFPEITVSLDGVPHTARMVVACRAGCYGGPFRVAPLADLGRPGLQVLLLRRGGLVAMLRHAAALAMGRLHLQDDVAVIPASSMVVTAPVGAPLQADGDPMGAAPVEVGWSDRTIRILMP
ncbi:MAG: NAD(+)/NADH kinase, partial [Alphaproteobacteria bacterium]|nr:NAD(+)/NADH kinase [Alphaproteobacteria bacterium]